MKSVDLINHIKTYVKSIPDGPSKLYRIRAYNVLIKKLKDYEIITKEIIKCMDISDRMKESLYGFLKQPISKLDPEIKLQNITGIGPELAKQLVKEGITTRAQLKKKKYFDNLPLATQIDLTYSPIKRIPRIVCDRIVKLLNPPSQKIPHIFVGSYRRGRPYSSDIDILILDRDVERFVKYISKLDIHIYSQGPSKISTLLRISGKYIKFDIFITSKKSYPFALMYSTGSKEFNINMRKIAKRRGYLLNQEGLYDSKGNEFRAKNERDIFKLLGMEYVSPEER